MPEDATPPVVQKFDNDSTPVISISLAADRSLRELTELADKTARVQLERVGGVGEVRVVGGLERAINVWIDADRLAAYQIPITAVSEALNRQNTDVPGGNVDTGREELVLRTLGRYTDPKTFEDLIDCQYQRIGDQAARCWARRRRHQGAAIAFQFERCTDGVA